LVNPSADCEMIYCTYKCYSMARIATSYPLVVTRLARNCALGRLTQYPRDVSDRTDKARRTGSSSCAEDDSRILRRYLSVIASAATQSIYPRAETWIASLRSQ